METYGIVIERDGEYTISGDGFIENTPTSYQIIRSTYFSLIWKAETKYILHIVKYPVDYRNYLQFAHNCRSTNTWRYYLVTTFNISYEQNPYDVNKKMLTFMSEDNTWDMTMNVLKYGNSTNEFTISLPYLSKVPSTNIAINL